MSINSSDNQAYSPAYKTALLVFNGLLFQLGWFSSVLGGDTIALVVSLFILIIHHLFFVTDKKEWLLIATIACIGLAIDSILSLTGILVFTSVSFGIPVWLFCIWVLFACTINHSLSWLKQKPLLALLMGAIAGPSSYFAGSKLSDVSFAQPLLLSLVIMAVVWALVLPILTTLSKQLSSDITDV